MHGGHPILATPATNEFIELDRGGRVVSRAPFPRPEYGERRLDHEATQPILLQIAVDESRNVYADFIVSGGHALFEWKAGSPTGWQRLSGAEGLGGRYLCGIEHGKPVLGEMGRK